MGRITGNGMVTLFPGFGTFDPGCGGRDITSDISQIFSSMLILIRSTIVDNDDEVPNHCVLSGVNYC